MRMPLLWTASLITLAAHAAPGWEQDLTAAKARAAKEGKLLFVDIWAEWCPPCQYLKSTVFPDPAAQKALQRYVPVSLMTETRDRRPQAVAAALAAQYRVGAYPTLIVMDAKGKELKRQVGAFRNGQELAAWLNAK